MARIAFVSHNTDALSGLVRPLHKKGHTVIDIRDDKELARKLGTFDLIIIQGNGTSFVATINNHKGELPPIIYIATLTEPQIKAAFTDIEKSILPSELLKLAENLLR